MAFENGTLPTRAGLRHRASCEHLFCDHQKVDTGLKFLVLESVCEINCSVVKKYRFLDQTLEKNPPTPLGVNRRVGHLFSFSPPIVLPWGGPTLYF